MAQKERMDVFHVQGEGERSNWTKVGVAFVNQDGSLNVLVNYLPTNLARLGTLTLNVRKPNGKGSQAPAGGKGDDDF